MSAVLDKFLDYQRRLTESTQKDANVIGLVFAGSAADHSRVDQYSDQDFFLIVREGQGEVYRNDLSWLPDFEDIVISPRETAHGLKVVYQNGDLLEFAVFEDSELELGAANDYAVAVDKQDIAERMSKIAERTAPKPADRATDWELFLSLILIGVGRARRGEIIAAEQHVKSYALDKALRLIRLAKPVSPSSADSFNSYRRFEKDYPALGSSIGNLLLLPTEQAAKSLTVLVADVLELDDQEQAQLAVVFDSLGWD